MEGSGAGFGGSKGRRSKSNGGRRSRGIGVQGAEKRRNPRASAPWKLRTELLLRRRVGFGFGICPWLLGLHCSNEEDEDEFRDGKQSSYGS